MLSRDLLQGIYIPSSEQEKIRGLVRVRQSMAKDKRRAMARIRSFAFRSGLAIPPELANKLWTRAGQRWLEEQSASDEELSVFVDAYKSSRQLEADAIRVLGARIKASDEYAALQELLRSIPGVGRLTSALLIGEIGDMGRFKNLDPPGRLFSRPWLFLGRLLLSRACLRFDMDAQGRKIPTEVIPLGSS